MLPRRSPPSIPVVRSAILFAAFFFRSRRCVPCNRCSEEDARDRGELPVGRKIGFTNRTIWAEYNVYEPVWGYVYDRTVHNSPRSAKRSRSWVSRAANRAGDRLQACGRASSGHGEGALLESIDWVAHGFEIVQSIFPGWKFSAPDTVGLHGALLIGPRHSIAGHTEDWGRTLPTFEIDLKRDGTVVDHGRATNMLGGPVSALSSSHRYSLARRGQSTTRSRRDRHDGNADACTSGVWRRDIDDRTHGCRA